jgi:hypothetical protein
MIEIPCQPNFKVIERRHNSVNNFFKQVGAQRAAPQVAAWAPRSSICAAPGASAWAPRSSTCGAVGIGLGTTIKYLRRKTRQRPARPDQVPATQNEWRLGQLPGHYDQLPATHNERRRVQRPEPMQGLLMCPITPSAPHST